VAEPALVAPVLAVLAAAASAALLVPERRRLDGLEGLAESGGPDRPAAGPALERETQVLRLVSTLAAAVATVTLVGGAVGGMAAVGTASVCWWLVGRLEPASARRRRERLVAAVPQAVDLLAACLGAGLATGPALEQIAAAVEPPLSEELSAITRRLRLGVDPGTVWRDVAAHPQLGGLGRAVARATESGASVADAMLRLADDLRSRSRAATENRARAVGVKAAIPLGVCLLPAFVLVGVVPLVAGSLSVLLVG
jgi:Flp pilus assembly protein TadB